MELLIKTLVKANQIPAALKILKEPKTMNGIAATQDTYFPVLKALMKRGSHAKMISLIDQGRFFGVKFTMKVLNHRFARGNYIDKPSAACRHTRLWLI